MDVRMAGLLLAGAHHTELLEVVVRIDEHRAWLCRKHDGVLRRHMACLHIAQSFALHHPEVGIVHVLIDIESVSAVLRRQCAVLCLAVHYLSENGAVWR